MKYPVPLHVMHLSLQYSDTRRQQRADLRRLFTRANERDVAWVTGTEAGPETHYYRLLRYMVARKMGWKVCSWRDVWIAVPQRRVMKRSWMTGSELVAPSSEVIGRGHDTGFVWCMWHDLELDRVISLACGHYPTGWKKGLNHAVIEKFSRKLSTWVREHGRGKALAFYQGDQNMPDNLTDTFHGGLLLSVGDELGFYENTGHGAIDVSARSKRDKKVSATYLRVLDDREFPLHSDHFLVEAGYEVAA